MLFDLEWPEIKVFLLNDIKLSDKPSALSAVKSRFKKLRAYFHGKEFNRTNFNDFIASLREQNYSISYINNFIKIGKHIDRFLKINEIQDYTYFRENIRWSGDTLSPEQIERIINIKIPYRINKDQINLRNRALYWLISTTGCRVGEALNLCFKDIHAQPTYVVFRDTKSDEDRPVPISGGLYKLLMKLPRDNELVFTSRSKKLLSSQEINLDLKRRAIACNIDIRVYNHLLRHSYITTMKESGVDNADIAVLVGHKDPKTTARYTHGTLNYYSEVILNHPLLRQEQSWENLINQLKKQIGRIVNTKKFRLTLKEDRKMFEIKLIKL